MELGLRPRISDSSGRAVDQLVEVLFLQVLVQLPALDLLERLVELAARQRLVDEALAARELAEVPGLHGLELGRDGVLPERQVAAQVFLERPPRAIEAAPKGAPGLEPRAPRPPPPRMKLA